MPPRSTAEQTKIIIQCLFEDLKGREELTEPDGVQEDSFDPTLIAEKLRKLGDDYEEQVIQPLMKEIQKAAADESAEVAPERLLLKASIFLGLYAKRNCPDLNAVIQETMTAFINTQVAPWVSQQGGWVGSSDLGVKIELFSIDPPDEHIPPLTSDLNLFRLLYSGRKVLEWDT
ncbi:bcl-2-like protein 15-like [Scleropages formosus]|uniref:Bcl-2-like protein 15-like n=1 Tax=Scleropages formosus TaxID=113540 RepID=A0A0P7UJ12_SCLFO|nr:bcl-2-like protein 15-like [Scleropages formosus]